MVELANGTNFSAHCLYHEIRDCIAAAFEIPALPVADGEIEKAVRKAQEAAGNAPSGAIHRFRAFYGGGKFSLWYGGPCGGERWRLIWDRYGLARVG